MVRPLAVTAGVADHSRRRAVAAGLLRSERCRPGELAVVTGLLVLVAVAAFGDHVRDGSFYYDDWANSARTQLAGGYGDALRSFWDLTGYRPVLAFYVPTLHELLGESPGLHLAWAGMVAVLMSAALYAVLGELRVPRLHALIISALVLVFPFSVSTRMWATSATCHLTAALWLGGLVLALRALDAGRPRRSALVLHGASLTFYLVSLLLYELPATLMVGAGTLYLLKAGWRRGLTRWAADLLVVVPSLGYILTNTKIETAPDGAGRLEHVRLILDQGWQIMASAAWPFGSVSRGVVTVAVAAVLGTGAWVAFRRRRDDPVRAALVGWLALAGGGFVATWTAWAVFVPGDLYYSPGTQGVGNRVNALPAMGIVTLLYAVAAVAATLLFHWAGRPGRVAPLVACAAGLVLFGTYLGRVYDDQAAWNAAARSQSRTLAVLRAGLPAPEPGSVIWTFGQALWQAPGVPIFASSWDLNGAVQLAYDDPTLRGYPAQPLTTFDCEPDGLSPAEAPGSPRSPYGRAYFVDVPSGLVDRITDPDDCRAAAARFRPGPFHLPEVSP